MSIGQRGLIMSSIMTVLVCFLLSLWIPWSTLAQSCYLIIVVTVPIFSLLWKNIERKWQASRIVSTYERSRPAQTQGIQPTTSVPRKSAVSPRLYQQGYPTQTSNTSFPFHTQQPEQSQVKQDHVIDYDQPQAQYEQTPPPMV